MADTVEERIFRGLIETVKTLALPTGWTIPTHVDMPDMAFTPRADKPFLAIEVHFNKSIETDLSLEMDAIRQGFVNLRIEWPKGQGAFQSIAFAGVIREHFRRGTKIWFEGTRTDVDEDPEIMPSITGLTHVGRSVIVRWTCQPEVPA